MEPTCITDNQFVGIVNNLNIYHYYSDTYMPGADDDCTYDYIIIYESSDYYIYRLLLKILEPNFSLTNDLCYIELYWKGGRNNARTPIKGLYRYGVQQKFKLWLILEIAKFYNKEEHLSTDNTPLVNLTNKFHNKYIVSNKCDPCINIHKEILYYNLFFTLIDKASENVIDKMSVGLDMYFRSDDFYYRKFAYYKFFKKYRKQL